MNTGAQGLQIDNAFVARWQSLVEGLAWKRLRRTAYIRRGGPPTFEDVQDAVQSVWLHLLETASYFDPELSSVGPWIRRVTNQALMRLLKPMASHLLPIPRSVFESPDAIDALSPGDGRVVLRRGGRPSEQTSNRGAGAPLRVPGYVNEPWPDPERAVAAARTYELASRAMPLLRSKHRRALEARMWGLSTSEAARVEGVTQQAISLRGRTAIEDLLQIMDHLARMRQSAKGQSNASRSQSTSYNRRHHPG